MRLLEFDWNTYSGKNMLIVYGTEGFGKIVRHCLKKRNITPEYYVNGKGTGTFYGVPVIGLDKLTEIYHEKKPVILLAVGKASREVALKLSQKKIDEVYSVYNLLEDITDIGDLLDPVYGIRNHFFYEQERFINSDKLVLRTLDIVVTEKCSLKCEKCSNLMQYYSMPKNLNISEIRDSFDKLLEAVDKIYELRILGGEPFMNPEFYSLVDWYADHPKIKKIVIFTNATIFPEEEQLEKLKKPNIQMRLSDYDELSSSMHRWITWCDENRVEYLISKMEKWQDCGKLEKRCYSLSEIRYIYETCQCRELPTLLNGALYNCPYAANAINLGALYEEEAEKDKLVINDTKDLKERMKRFLFEREYLMSCDYCAGRNSARAFVRPHRQTAKPLEYDKRCVGI